MLFALLADREPRSHRPAGGAALPGRRDPGRGARLRRRRRRPRRWQERRRDVRDPVPHRRASTWRRAARSGSRTRRRCPARSRGATASRASRRGPASSIATAAASATTTCTSITSRSRRARRARRCCCSASRRGRPVRAGHRHRRLQRRRVEPRAARAGRPAGRPARPPQARRAPPFIDTFRAVHRDEQDVGTFTASPSGGRRATRSTTCWCSRARPCSTRRSCAPARRALPVGPLPGDGADPAAHGDRRPLTTV